MGGGLGGVPIPTRGMHCGTLDMYVLCDFSYYVYTSRKHSEFYSTPMEKSPKVKFNRNERPDTTTNEFSTVLDNIYVRKIIIQCLIPSSLQNQFILFTYFMVGFTQRVLND